jgi:hypothetical protein
VQPLTVPGQTSTIFALSIDGVEVPVLAYKDIHYAQAAGPGALIRNVVFRNSTRAGVPIRAAKDCGVSTNEPFVGRLCFEFTDAPPRQSTTTDGTDSTNP